MMLSRIVSNPKYTVDQFEHVAWITSYDVFEPSSSLESRLRDQGIRGVVVIEKLKSKLPEKTKVWFGHVPETLIVNENGVQFEIRTTSSHPGLFLDHQLTRQWLTENSENKTVLNLFSYTGSLGIAAAVGGASETTNIDLAKSATDWAKKNAELNRLGPQHQFIKGDVFDWTKRFAKKNRTFDVVISDPPSQSRSDILHFSTEKHMDQLHEACIQLLGPKGILISSVNSEKLNHKVLTASVINIAKKLQRNIGKIHNLDLPDSFDPNFRSMRGIRVFFGS